MTNVQNRHSHAFAFTNRCTSPECREREKCLFIWRIISHLQAHAININWIVNQMQFSLHAVLYSKLHVMIKENCTAILKNALFMNMCIDYSHHGISKLVDWNITSAFLWFHIQYCELSIDKIPKQWMIHTMLEIWSVICDGHGLSCVY